MGAYLSQKAVGSLSLLCLVIKSTRGGVTGRVSLASITHVLVIAVVLLLISLSNMTLGEKSCISTSLVVQRLRIYLPMQGIPVQSLAQEDPTCCGATKPMRHNYSVLPLLSPVLPLLSRVLPLLSPVLPLLKPCTEGWCSATRETP